MGALGLSDGQPVHPRGEADRRGPEQARAGDAPGLQGRQAVAQLPERRGAGGAAGDRRLHRPQHHHQRLGERQPDAAPEGHSVGPGARHHHADEGARHAQERQCRADRAARGARVEGEAAARGAEGHQRARAARFRIVPVELHQGAGPAQPHHDEPPAAVRRRGGSDRDHRRPGIVHFEARGRDGRSAVEHPVRAGHTVQPRGDSQDHPPDRHGDPPGGDRGPHRDRERQIRPAARRALRSADRIPDQQQVHGRARAAASARSRSLRQPAPRRRARRERRRRTSSRRESPMPATRIRRSSTSTCRC